MGRIHNFSAGPAALPEPVLRRAQADLLDWQDRGLSVMEMSHRGEAFREIAAQAEADLRALYGLPDSHAVLFLQGGATQQFAAAPLNLGEADDRADYLVTGSWSKKALGEGRRLIDAQVAATDEEAGFVAVPPRDSWQLRPDAAYLHVTLNETINGVQLHEVPDVGESLLVADASSCFLSEPLDLTRFGVLYAGAQKNAGPAGVTILIVRRDLLGRARKGVPMVMDWTKQEKAGSMLNTPPCWAWYVTGLVFRQLLEEGGLTAARARNARKAEKLYAAIEASELYASPVAPAARSRMNVPFTLRREGLDADFLSQAADRGLQGLKGHRSVGGMRASIYNAVSEEAVDALIEFLVDFEKQNVRGT